MISQVRFLSGVNRDDIVTDPSFPVEICIVIITVIKLLYRLHQKCKILSTFLSYFFFRGSSLSFQTLINTVLTKGLIPDVVGHNFTVTGTSHLNKSRFLGTVDVHTQQIIELFIFVFSFIFYTPENMKIFVFNYDFPQCKLFKPLTTRSSVPPISLSYMYLYSIKVLM